MNNLHTAAVADQDILLAVVRSLADLVHSFVAGRNRTDCDLGPSSDPVV